MKAEEDRLYTIEEKASLKKQLESYWKGRLWPDLEFTTSNFKNTEPDIIIEPKDER